MKRMVEWKYINEDSKKYDNGKITNKDTLINIKMNILIYEKFNNINYKEMNFTLYKESQ